MDSRLKRTIEEAFVASSSSSSCKIGDSQDRKKCKKNEPSDMIIRQKILASMIRRQTRTKEEEAFQNHVNSCESTSCPSMECTIGKKSFQHFQKCQKEECILCVEARLVQVTENISGDEEELFTMNSFYARLHQVNEETQEVVPYFNSCAQELAIAKSIRSPFFNTILQQFLQAKAFVSQSEKKYEILCKEIFQKWVVINADTNSTGTAESSSSNSTTRTTMLLKTQEDSPVSSVKKIENSNENSTTCWQNGEDHQSIRAKMLEKICVWFRLRSQGDEEAGKKLIEDAKTTESKLYFMAKSREDYEDESTLMSRLLEI